VRESVYMDHLHRTLKKTPREALSGALSERQVSLERLSDAFFLRTTKRAHPKTGEVELGGELLKVPREFAGRKLDFAFDPVDSQIAFLHKENGTRVRLRPAIEKVREKPAQEVRGSGRLQTLYDYWQGRRLPQAQAGFGLPEIFELLEKLFGRKVPRDEEEARLLQDFYPEKGPLGRNA